MSGGAAGAADAGDATVVLRPPRAPAVPADGAPGGAAAPDGAPSDAVPLDDALADIAWADVAAPDTAAFDAAPGDAASPDVASPDAMPPDAAPGDAAPSGPAPPELVVPELVVRALGTLLELRARHPAWGSPDPRRTVEALRGEIDRLLAEAVNAVIHHPEFLQMEAAWRGLHFLVRAAEPGGGVRVRVLDASKRELARSLRKFRGTAWDQSPLFRRIYEEEYGQLGGEPFGLLVGDYEFDHEPADVALLADIARIAAASHAPFVTGAAPAVMGMGSWAELANPRDLTRIFGTPEYAAWRALREAEDARYVGLCMPRFLGRLPYGAGTDPQEDWAFEERLEGEDTFAWVNAAFALAANAVRAFSQYGWCTRIRGIDEGGVVEGVVAHVFASADGLTERKCVTEVALSERREAELSRGGFIPLLHRKNTGLAAFVSAQSLQAPVTYAQAEATANAVLSARLPYLLACCRFAHYLKCMMRDKVGSTLNQGQLVEWLEDWLTRYVDGNPDTSSEAWKAAHPLAEARVEVEERPGAPGQYEARFFLRPHYQLEGMSLALRLVSRVPAA